MLISYSGGVDSGLLAALAKEVLGERSHCVLLDSPAVPRPEVRDAERHARELGLSFEIVPAPVMENPLFRSNTPDRCYLCKKIMAGVLNEKARELGLACIADGLNRSDTGERRPGLQAAAEEGIVHPFIEAGISKDEIREIARHRGHGFWDKLPAACTCTRIPYGEEITTEKLRMIEAAEDYLHARGFATVRVRLQGRTARIEVEKADIPAITAMGEEIAKEFRKLGFSYVSLDLEGYRSGSMDEVL